MKEIVLGTVIEIITSLLRMPPHRLASSALVYQQSILTLDLPSQETGASHFKSLIYLSAPVDLCEAQNFY
jgi:hypothetical protein